MIPVVINVMDEVLIGGGTILTLAIPSIDTGTIPVTLIGVISTTFTDNGIDVSTSTVPVTTNAPLSVKIGCSESEP